MNFSKNGLIFLALGLLFFVRGESVVEDDSLNELSALTYLNKSVNPCDDFYEYVCGNFKNEHPLSDKDLVIDHFTLLEEELTELLNATLSTKKRRDDPVALRKAKSAYEACLNTEYMDTIADPELTVVREEGGFPLIQPFYLQLLHNFDWIDVAKAVSEYGIPMIFQVVPYAHPKDASKNVLYISSDTMSNPSMIRPYNDLTDDERIEKSFLEFAHRKLSRSSSPQPFDIFLKKMAMKILTAEWNSIKATEDEIERNIDEMATFMRSVYAGGILPENTTIPGLSTEMTITLKELNKWTRNQFGNSVHLDWVEYMQTIFSRTGMKITEDTEVLNYVNMNNLIYGILNLVRSTNDYTVKNFVMMRIFLFMAIDSDYTSRNLLENYYKGINIQIKPRWQYCTRKIMDSYGSIGLSLALAYEYQLRYFDVNGFSQVVEMLRDLQTSFEDIISESEWMNENMKEIAQQKLKNMITILGFPDFLTNVQELDKFYQNLKICRWDNYGNSQRIRSFKYAYLLSQIKGKNREFWDKSPFETNAYYNRPNNRVIIPLAMLNGVFFGSGNRILDYARLGSILGHEITHGFDTAGQNYDAEGLLNAWGNSSITNYTDCFLDQYSKYYISEINDYVNASKTMDETLADNGGTKESYKAMKRLTQTHQLTPGSSGYTIDQLFFIGFANMWCNNPSKSYLQQQLQNDPHAPAKWRVNGVVSNMKEFSDAFGCPTGSPMNPERKCKMW